jgi:hypothetical protein
MRTPLVCALALLCGAELAHGQAWSGGAYPGYQATPAGGYAGYASTGYTGYNRPQQEFYAPTPYMAPPEGSAEECEGQSCTPQGVPASVSAAYSDEYNGGQQQPDHCTNHFWLSGNYAMLFIRPERVAVPLVAVGSPSDFPPGAIGQPGTQVLSGDTFNFGMLSGVQVDAGVFLGGGDCCWLQWTGLFVDPGHVRYQVASNAAGSPLISRPVVNSNTGAQGVVLDSLPGTVAGSFSADARTALFGTEANLGCRCYSNEGRHFDVLAGFRYLRLAEDLVIIDEFQPLVPGFLNFQHTPVGLGNSLADMDRFSTTNNFYGGQIGGQYACEFKHCFISTFGKVALGVTNETVDINGSTALITPTGRNVAGGGVLALPSNMGKFTRNVLGFVPEGGLTVGCNVSKHVQLMVGYSFLWWNAVVRPGSQLNPAVNPTQIPTSLSFGTPAGAPSPLFKFNSDNFWVNSLTCGVTVHY